MAGIYIHIPFCKKACHYCNFHFSTSLNLKNEFVAALLKEIELQKAYTHGEKISTIYFGGGTPSLLSATELFLIMEKLKTCFDIDPGSEITMEANPDDIRTESIHSWKNAGINRLSIGIQSFFKEDLLWMNRAHDDKQAYHCIEIARDSGIGNLTIDLIYGTPTLSDDRWKHNISTAINLGIPHLSCYALTVEPKTPLDFMIRKKSIKEINAEDQARQFLLLMDWMEAAGYEHYEISNFAMPGKRSLHNSAYWLGACYLGLGPSAHSYNGSERQWNISNNALYIHSLNNGLIPFEKESLSPVQRLNEYIMTASRTLEGINLLHMDSVFGVSKKDTLLEKSRKHITGDLLYRSDERLMLTRKGKLFADGIASDLFFEESE